MPQFVLIVDDDLNVGATLSIIVEAGGYQVRYFPDPKLLVDELSSLARTPDLLITDYRMPNINGLELIQICRAWFPKLKTLSVSGALSRIDTDQYPVKPDAVLLKPFRREELLKLIGDLLQ